jgi:hypothetical protein
MKISVISDAHEFESGAAIPPCDLLLHTGDFTFLVAICLRLTGSMHRSESNVHVIALSRVGTMSYRSSIFVPCVTVACIAG